MTTEKKQEIINRLFAEQCSCIICNNHEIRLFHERGVKEVFAGVISRPALSLFQSHGIEPEYKIETEYIINRTRTGWCPLESRCKNLGTPEDCLAEIDDFMNTMKNI